MKMWYNYFRVRDFVIGIVFVVIGLVGFHGVLNSSNQSNLIFLFDASLVIFGSINLLSSIRYKAHAVLDNKGIQIRTKDTVLATVSWDKIISCQYFNPWGGELKGPKYTVLFTRKSIDQDPQFLDFNKELIDRHMYALHRKRITPEEFEDLGLFVFWAFGGKRETKEIQSMINNFENCNTENTGDGAVCSGKDD